MYHAACLRGVEIIEPSCGYPYFEDRRNLYREDWRTRGKIDRGNFENCDADGTATFPISKKRCSEN